MATESLFSQSSLALIASGGAGKDGKVYSIRPTDGTGDFAFSRGSNLAATRVGADGLIEKGRENLLLQSNAFNVSPWLNQLGTGTITSGQTGYDGTNDAWEITKDTSTSRSVRQPISSSGVLTYSVYAKAGTLNDAALRVDTTAGAAQVLFDLTDGSSTLVGGVAISHDSVDIGNGWYRLIVIVNATITNVHIYVDRDGTTAGSILIQDAQLEIGLAATEVIETGGTTGKAGLLEDTPRFDYSGGTTCPSLLLEPSRAQLVPYSEYLGAMTNTRTTDSPNATTSPEGVQNASLVTDDSTAASSHFVRDGQYSLTSSTPYTFSFYAKSNGRNVGFNFDSVVGAPSPAIFNLSDGVVFSSGSFATSIEDAGNGWYRCIGAFTSSATASSFIYVRGADSGGSSIYDGDGTSGFYIWGFQLEQGYPTSYIPNHSGGTITRGVDVCVSAVNANNFNSTEGVLYAEVSLNLLTPNMYIQISDGTYSNRVAIINNNSSSIWRVFYRVNGVSQIDTSEAGLNTFETNKIAISWKLNEFKFYVNGVKITQVNSGSVNPANTFNTLEFKDITGNNFFGNMKQVLVFPTALSDAELTELTTI